MRPVTQPPRTLPTYVKGQRDARVGLQDTASRIPSITATQRLRRTNKSLGPHSIFLEAQRYSYHVSVQLLPTLPPRGSRLNPFPAKLGVPIRQENQAKTQLPCICAKAQEMLVSDARSLTYFNARAFMCRR